ncbi:MAG: glycosyltransferase [Deltaproteobacteria bacterium]|jgi:hypothetical protein
MTTQVQVLEYGPFALFARTHPEVTRWVFSGRSVEHFPGSYVRPFSLKRLVALLDLVRRPGPGVVACHVPGPRLPRIDLGRLGYAAILRWSARPIVGLDFNDEIPLADVALRVLERSTLYFKREMPFRRDDLIATGDTASGETLRHNLDKLRPVSIGLAPWRVADPPDPLPPKSADVFFAGSTRPELRRRGAEQLTRLRDSGVAVDFVDGFLPRPGYLARMARAYLAWSPEGAGWQCFRHLEAPFVATVPVMSWRRVEVPWPLQDGEHCFEYEPEGDDLSRVMRRALVDRDRLRSMARAARERVLAHHGHRTVADEILSAVGAEAYPRANLRSRK